MCQLVIWTVDIAATIWCKPRYIFFPRKDKWASLSCVEGGGVNLNYKSKCFNYVVDCPWMFDRRLGEWLQWHVLDRSDDVQHHRQLGEWLPPLSHWECLYPSSQHQAWCCHSDGYAEDEKGWAGQTRDGASALVVHNYHLQGASHFHNCCLRADGLLGQKPHRTDNMILIHHYLQ